MRSPDDIAEAFARALGQATGCVDVDVLESARARVAMIVRAERATNRAAKADECNRIVRLIHAVADRFEQVNNFDIAGAFRELADSLEAGQQD